MSERLLIGHGPHESSYDCILTAVDGAREKLLKQWVCLHADGYSAGPLRVFIMDVETWHDVAADVEAAVVATGRKYPDDVWMFSIRNDAEDRHSMIEHPTAHELRLWLEAFTA
jgi:hypothetical protein